MKVSKKISISFVILFFILIIGMLLLIRMIYGSFAFDQFYEQVDFSSRLISNQVEKYVESVEEGTADLVITLNREFERELKQKANFDGTDLTVNQRIFSILNTSLNMREDVCATNMISIKDLIYVVEKPNYFTQIVPQDKEKNFEKDISLGTKGIWYRIYNEDKKKMEYVHIRHLLYIATMEHVGYVGIEMDTSALKQVYKNENTSSYMQYYILDEDNLVISGSDSAYVGKSMNENEVLLQVQKRYEKSQQKGNFVQEGTNIYYTYVKIPNTSWSLVTLMDHTEVNKKLNMITLLLMACGVLLMFVLSVVVNLISKSLAKPIVRLSNHLKNTESGLLTEVEESREYHEVAHLIQQFNLMVKNNNRLFTRVQEEEERKHKLEISIVQAQIKPHFLYNTLDTAYILVDMEESEKAKKTLKLLADYYRSVLNKGLVWTSLEREVESVCTYIQIQQMRYVGQLEYEIDLAEEVRQIYIPNLTLQPLVENAIYHGLKPNKKGKIRIVGRMEKFWIYVSVIDDGVGFSKEKFDEIMGRGSHQVSDSFGMKNIQDRLRLCYGKESKLELFTNEEKETILRVRIYLGSKEEK